MQSDFQTYIRERVTMNAGGCWIWQRSTDRDGYGEGSFRGRKRKAHRLAYEAFTGQIPQGLLIDHLCRVRACVNSAHLEAVTCGENIRRGNSGTTRKTHCKRGHAFAEHGAEREHGRNRCLLCARGRNRASYARKRVKEAHKLTETRVAV